MLDTLSKATAWNDFEFALVDFNLGWDPLPKTETAARTVFRDKRVELATDIQRACGLRWGDYS